MGGGRVTDADGVYCRECGAEIRRAAEICPDCGVRQRPAPRAESLDKLIDGRVPLVAVVLSALFPGLGHVYARDVDMGLFFAVSFILSVLSLVVLIGFILVPAIWIYAIYDAGKAAERRDAELTRSDPNDR